MNDTDNPVGLDPARKLANRKNRFDNEACSVEYVVTTKELVDMLLAGNEKNRKPTESHVKKLAMDFRNNRYVFTGQPIIRDDKGYLRDGQHRLIAIKNAGYPSVPILVVTLHGDQSHIELAYDRMDINKTRTYAQRLLHKEIEHSSAVASLRKKITYLKTNFNSFPVVSDAIYDEIGRMYAYEIEKIAPLIGDGFTTDMGAAACLVARATGCLNDCLKVVEKAKLGIHIDPGTPEHTLMKIINKRLRAGAKKQARNAFNFAVVANCLIAALQGNRYPVADSNSSKACKWIVDMAAENEVPLLPQAMKDA